MIFETQRFSSYFAHSADVVGGFLFLRLLSHV